MIRKFLYSIVVVMIIKKSFNRAFPGRSGCREPWRLKLPSVKSSSHEMFCGDNGSFCETVSDGKKCFQTSHKPPLPPQPPHHRHNRYLCGECCLCREFNSSGECCFPAKAAVVVGAATPSITTVYFTNPSLYRCGRNRNNQDESGGVDAKPLLLGVSAGGHGRRRAEA